MNPLGKRIFLFCALILFLFSGFTIIRGSSDVFQPPATVNDPFYPDKPIINIVNNDGFVGYANGGNGSKNNPYIISNRNFNCSPNLGIIAGISIMQTTSFFILTNLTFSNCNLALYLVDVHHGLIEDSTINSGSVGIYSGIDISINNINVKNSSYDGISIDNTKSFSIQNTRIEHSTSGLDLSYCSNGYIVNTIAINNSGTGYSLDSSKNINMTNNRAEFNNNGFDFINSSRINVDTNNATYNLNSGFSLDTMNQTNLDRNIASGSGSFNYFLTFSTLNNLTKNVALNSIGDGFKLQQSDSNNFFGNNASNNLNYGFNVINSNHNNFINNSAIGNTFGAYKEFSSIQSTFSDNSFVERIPKAQPDYTGYLIILIELSLIIGIPCTVYLKRNYEGFKVGNKNSEKKLSFKYYLRENYFWHSKNIRKKITRYKKNLIKK